MITQQKTSLVPNVTFFKNIVCFSNYLFLIKIINLYFSLLNYVIMII